MDRLRALLLGTGILAQQDLQIGDQFRGLLIERDDAVKGFGSGGILGSQFTLEVLPTPHIDIGAQRRIGCVGDEAV